MAILRATGRHLWQRLRARLPGSTQLAGDWLPGEPVLACAYPRRPGDLDALAAAGITLLINLHERAHDPGSLSRRGLREVHLPVPDFTPPSPTQLDHAVAAIVAARAADERVAVHCGAGLGRTGTVLACYLVQQGQSPAAAIATVRRVRPGAVETAAQAAAVSAYAAQLAHANSTVQKS